MPAEMSNLWLIPYGTNGRQLQPESQPEQAGFAYEVRLIRDRITKGLPPGDSLRVSLTPSASGNELSSMVDSQMDPETPEYLEWLNNLDPAEFKSQDHYRVIGMSKLRWKATEDELRTAYRSKVLKHHPDKRGAKVASDEDYFACMVKAYDILGNPVKRREFDSVDPTFNDEIPTKSEVDNFDSDAEFYSTFGPVFEENSRWSRESPVPKLGDDQTDFTLVELFYQFWYNFDSWRQFGYLDEEDKEKGENREERRWIDKQNKTLRDKRRKDEIRRIRTLVELAHSCDPRVKRFREAEKNRKETEKQAKADVVKQKRMAEESEKQKLVEAEQIAKAAEDEKQKIQAAEERKVREERKKQRQKERKSILALFKAENFFADSEEEKICRMAQLDRLCANLSGEKLTELNSVLQADPNADRMAIVRQFEAELDEKLAQSHVETKVEGKSGGHGEEENSQPDAKWSEAEVKLLVKAVTLFPPGTQHRWEVISNFLNEHHHSVTEGSQKKTAKDVVAKAKNLQKLESSAALRPERSGLAGLEPSKSHGGAVESAPSERLDDTEAPWTPEEQKRLEAALRSHPASDPERWGKITACLPGRSKTEVKRRYKELAELVRAKKSAIIQTAAAEKKSF